MIKKTAPRMRFCVICLLLILAFIWGNSLLPRTNSDILSNSVSISLQKLFPFLFSGNGNGDGWLRKAAHFSEFALLSGCLCWLFAMLRDRFSRQIPPVLLCGILAACIDETIQRYIPGRNGNLTDVCIDTAGVIAGILIFTIGYFITNNMNQRNLEELK